MGFYRLLTDLGAPAIGAYLNRRLTRGREDKSRFQERLGHASAVRPAGKLVWCHAASVGEAMSVLSLIRALRTQYPDWHILLTTGTVTSAQMLASRLPEGAVHQYMPVDRWPYVTRFLDHWKPDLALWVESELWPNMLQAMRERRITALLLNGRMSEKSFKQWSYVKGWAREILGTFKLGLAQTETEKLRFEMLGLSDMRCIGNLKFAAEPLPVDEAILHALKTQLGARPVWLMASTHDGEDEAALKTAQALQEGYPDLLTIIVPRHPARGDEIVNLLQKYGLKYARRSAGNTIKPDTAIYLADTMGELGLFYRLCSIVCLGGSFVWGGHNPVEPAQLDCAIIFGPRMMNFAAIAAELVETGGAVQIRDAAQLPMEVARLLGEPGLVPSLAAAARRLTAQKHHMLGDVMNILAPYLKAQQP